jgi:hypothetical protein
MPFNLKNSAGHITIYYKAKYNTYPAGKRAKIPKKARSYLSLTGCFSLISPLFLVLNPWLFFILK